jgi:hypothetical protein
MSKRRVSIWKVIDSSRTTSNPKIINPSLGSATSNGLRFFQARKKPIAGREPVRNFWVHHVSD